MGQKLEIPTEYLEFGGLRVSMQNSLSDSIDSVKSRRKGVQANIWTGTRTANAAYNLTGLLGTAVLAIHLKISAVTISSGALNLLIRRIMPNAAYDTICNVALVTGTPIDKILIVHNDVTSVLRDISAFGAATNTVYDGPWGDTVEFQVYGTGTYTVTGDVNYWAM